MSESSRRNEQQSKPMEDDMRTSPSDAKKEEAVNIADLVTQIGQLDPQSKDAFHVLKRMETKIVEAVEAIDVVGESTLDEEKRLDARQQKDSLLIVLNHVKDLQELFSLNQLKRKGDEPRDLNTIREEILQLQREYVECHKNIEELSARSNENNIEESEKAARAYAAKLASIHVRLETLEKEVNESAETSAEREDEVPDQQTVKEDDMDDATTKRVEELAVELRSIQTRYQQIMVEMKKEGASEATMEALTKEVVQLSIQAKQLRQGLELLQNDATTTEKREEVEYDSRTVEELRVACELAEEYARDVHPVEQRRQFLDDFFKRFDSPLRDDADKRKLLVDAMVAQIDKEVSVPPVDDASNYRPEDDPEVARDKKEDDVVEGEDDSDLEERVVDLLHSELDRCVSRSGRSVDFLMLLFRELKHFPIDQSAFRLKFLQACENLRGECERERQRKMMNANDWSVRRNHSTQTTYDYAESVEGDADVVVPSVDVVEGKQVFDDALQVVGHGIAPRNVASPRGGVDRTKMLSLSRSLSPKSLRAAMARVSSSSDQKSPSPRLSPKRVRDVISKDAIEQSLLAEHESTATNSICAEQHTKGE